MPVFLRRLLLLAVAALAGCVTTASRLSNPEQYRSVIAIAAMPNSLPVNYIGLTVFNNRREIARVDWGLTDLALKELTGQLGRRYQVAPLPIDPMVLTGKHRDGASYDDLSGPVRNIVGALSADIVVLIDAVSMLDPGDKTDKWPRFGPYIGRKAFGYDAGSEVGYIADILVFDGRTFALLAQTRIFERRNYPFPVEGQPYERFTEAMKSNAQRSVTEMVPLAIEVGLRRLGLI